MPLNNTQRKQVQRAEKELRIKKQLEKNFSKELNLLFRKIGADLSRVVAENGGTVSANNYSRQLALILDRNYKRTQRRFSREIIDFILANKSNIRESIIRELEQIANFRGTTIRKMMLNAWKNIKRDFQAFREFNVLEVTDVVTATTQREIDRSVKKANDNLVKKLDRNPTNAELSKETRKVFLKRQSSRSRMIAATETQKAAESSKQIERDNIFSIRNGLAAQELGLEIREPEEVWVTQGDSLVRDGDGEAFDHLSADGQKKKNGVFKVSGELLRFPGDRSLGASLGNVINCRCSAVTVIS